GAAQHLAARLVGGAAVEAGNGLALELPVVAGVRVELVVADGDVDPRVVVAPAGFQEQHSIAARLEKARGDRAAGGARTGDDEVEGFLRHGPSPCAAANGAGVSRGVQEPPP